MMVVVHNLFYVCSYSPGQIAISGITKSQGVHVFRLLLYIIILHQGDPVSFFFFFCALPVHIHGLLFSLRKFFLLNLYKLFKYTLNILTILKILNYSKNAHKIYHLNHL